MDCNGDHMVLGDILKSIIRSWGSLVHSVPDLKTAIRQNPLAKAESVPISAFLRGDDFCGSVKTLKELQRGIETAASSDSP
jgi:hypothetical protein